MISVGDLQQYENNTMTHSSDQILQIAASIQEFWFNNPLLIDENKVLIAGHGKLLAAITLHIRDGLNV